MIGSKPILVIEDDEASAYYLEEVMGAIGIPVLIATTAAEAEAIITREDVCLILMDIRLPDMDGYELTRKFRTQGLKIPIIAQTAFVLPNDRERALSSGCNDYLTKPLRKEYILEMLKTYLDISATL
jgi:CheY-like chemotaxis protein